MMTALGNGWDCCGFASVRVVDCDGLIFIAVVAHHRLCENIEWLA
jgi:hypothetical protein